MRTLQIIQSLFGLSYIRHIHCHGELWSPSNSNGNNGEEIDILAQLQKRAEIAARMQQESPMAIRKMAADPDAMFFLQYWGFRDDVVSSGQSQMVNSSIDQGAMQPAILPVLDGTYDDKERPVLPRLFFSKRAFTCPSGTSSCSGIGRNDACCPDGLTCNIVSNTGQGDVGCCAGNSCSGQLAGCQDGYTECTSFGGGCCIPGYECVQGGCVAGTTQTIVVHPTPSSTSTSISTPIPTSSTKLIPPPTTTSVPSTSSTSSSSPTSSSTSSSSPPSPPPSTSSTAASVIPPARPTSGVATPVATIATPTMCPTGYYQCSAYYNAGACCQVGRDCGLTSCPAASQQTVVGGSGGGVTVLVPAGATAAAADAGPSRCAAGWYSCAASVGGDCCPTGFNCGTASCWINATAGAAQTGSTAKETPSGAGRLREPMGVGRMAAIALAIAVLTLL